MHRYPLPERLSCYAPLLALAAVTILVVGVFIGTRGTPALVPPGLWARTTGFEAQAIDAAARSRWALSMVVLLIAIAAALPWLLRDFLARCADAESRAAARMRRVAGIIVAASTLAYLAVELGWLDAASRVICGAEGPAQPFAVGGNTAAVLLTRLELHGYGNAAAFTRWTNVLAVATIIALTMAFCANLLASRNNDDRRANADRLLWIGSVLLVLTTIEVAALFGWAAAIAREEHRPVVELVASTHTLEVGVLLTLVLAALYLASVVVLGPAAPRAVAGRRRQAPGESVAVADDEPGDGHGRALSIVTRLIAVLGPLLAGGVTIDIAEILFS